MLRNALVFCLISHLCAYLPNWAEFVCSAVSFQYFSVRDLLLLLKNEVVLAVFCPAPGHQIVEQDRVQRRRLMTTPKKKRGEKSLADLGHSFLCNNQKP